MKKLLVPVDNSPNALRALDYAISIARGEHSPIELHIVTAHESAFDNPRALAYFPKEKLDRMLQAHCESIPGPPLRRSRRLE